MANNPRNRKPKPDQPRPGQDLSGLLDDIRTAEQSPQWHRRFPVARHHRPQQEKEKTLCQCHKPRLPDTLLCPDCAFQEGLVDEATRAAIHQMLESPENATLCECGNFKQPQFPTCKKCAIATGVIPANILPGQVPCPSCGDGRYPEFAYCAGCALTRGLLNQQGQQSGQVPTNKCSCGASKPAAYAYCAACYRQNRHRQETAEKTAGATEPCERCREPAPADKRFCRRCIAEMGAPSSEYHGTFNDRAKGQRTH